MVRKTKMDLRSGGCQCVFFIHNIEPLRVSHRKPRKLASSPPNTGPMAMLKLRTAEVNNPSCIQRAMVSNIRGKRTGLIKADETASF